MKNTKPYNRLWYKSEDAYNYRVNRIWKPFPKGTIVCYDHDNPLCKICPNCKDDLLCEVCELERTKHSPKQLLHCLKTCGILYRNNKSINEGIQHFLYSTRVYDKLILKAKLRNPDEPKEQVIAERINIPNRIDT